MKIVCIVGYETEYIDRLMRYMMMDPGIPYEVQAFSDVEYFAEFARDHRVDLLLCEEEIAAVYGKELAVDNIILLTEKYRQDCESGERSIFKYQSAELIMKRIRDFCENGNRPGKEEGKVISVWSPFGDSYKSTFALSLAKSLSASERVLFISFDPFFTMPGQPRVSERNLSDILYYLKQDNPCIESRIGSIIRSSGRLFYISGVSHWFDLQDFSPVELQKFMKVLFSQIGYDRIVIDVGFCGPVTMTLLEMSSIVYVPEREKTENPEPEKYAEWSRQLGFAGGEEVLSRLVRIKIPFDERFVSGKKERSSFGEGRYEEFLKVIRGELSAREALA